MSENVTHTDTAITYGEHTFDLSKLPVSSLSALVRRGISHYLGNEQAAKVSAAKAKRKSEIEAHAVKVKAGTAEGEAPVEHTDEEVAALAKDFVTAALAAIHGGTMGQGRVAGPKADPVDQVMRAIAIRELQTILKAQTPPMSLPTGEKVLTFPNGKSFTREQLVQSRVTSPKESERLRAAAVKEIRERDRAAKKAAEGVAGADLADALGL